MKTLVCLSILTICLIAGGASVWAVGAQSAHYKVTIDAVASGGGSCSSSHYWMIDSSIGQDSPAGLASSSSKSDNSGVVQYWQFFKNSTRDWTCYE